MTKFLADQHEKKPSFTWNYENDSGILSEEFQVIDNKTNIENPYSVIKPQDVKLITSDSHSLEFLTLCTIKNSKEDLIDQYMIKIDKSWIPFHSSDDIFHDFQVPSLDTLECIKNLTCNKESIENENLLIENESVSSWFMDVQDCKNYKDFNDFNDSFSNESMHVQIPANLQEKIEIVESDLFDDDFFINASNKNVNVEENISKNQDIEIITSDFGEKDSSYDSKCYHLENSKKMDWKEQNNTNLFKNDFNISYTAKECKTFSQETRVSATIEVDFQNILDEFTDSEGSEPLINNKFEQANIFDELLDGTSSDVDLFDFSNTEDNTTVIHNISNKDMIIDSSKSIVKRKTSNSPSQKLVQKKQKMLDIDTSDSESTIIPGTPPKIKKIKSTFSNNNKIAKSVTKNDPLDSDQDLFDDLEFETQFSLTSVKDKLSFDSEKEVILNNKKNEKFIDKNNDKKLLHKNLKKLSFDNNIEELQSNGKKMKDKNKEFQKDLNEDDELLLQEFSLLEKNRLLHKIQKQKQLKDKLLSNNQKDNICTSKKSSIMDLSDLNLNDWDDNFDVLPIRTNDSSSSSFFQNNTIQEKKNNQPQSVYNKNVSSTLSEKLDFPVSSNIKKLTATSLLNNKQICSIDLENRNKNFNIHEVKKPKISLLNLKRNLVDSVNKDEDCLVISPTKVNTNPQLQFKSEFTLGAIEQNCNNKEKKSSNVNVHNKKENSICSQFHKYDDSSTYNNKKNKIKARKVKNKFIDYEAEVTTSDETLDESFEEMDNDLTNFISYTEEQIDTVDMKAHYLQSLNKSPIQSGGFVFKPLKNLVPDCEIYSQIPSEVDNSYVNVSI
jgi:hypothetical protein